MSPDEARNLDMQYWLQNAEESLQSAEAELAAGRHRFSVNRIYYACFYAVSAALLAEGRHFVRHAGVRSALHQHLARPGYLAAHWAEFYDQLFDARHNADYGAFVEIDRETVTEYLACGRGFVAEMKRFLTPTGNGLISPTGQ